MSEYSNKTKEILYSVLEEEYDKYEQTEDDKSKGLYFSRIVKISEQIKNYEEIDQKQCKSEIERDTEITKANLEKEIKDRECNLKEEELDLKREELNIKREENETKKQIAEKEASNNILGKVIDYGCQFAKIIGFTSIGVGITNFESTGHYVTKFGNSFANYITNNVFKTNS